MSGPKKCSVCKNVFADKETVFRVFGSAKQYPKHWKKGVMYEVCSQCMTEIFPEGIEPEGGVDATLFDEGE